MKHLLVTWICLLPLFALSQLSSLGFNYQAVARSATGDILQNQSITVRIRIRANSIDGQVVYEETHAISTNEYGIFTMKIGNGNQVSSQNFQEIAWADNIYFVNVVINNEDISTDRLEAVPYSKYATSMQIDNLIDVNADEPSNGQVLKWNGNEWQPADDNTGEGSDLAAGEGITIADNTIINTAPDQIVEITAGDNIEVSGTYPSFEISATGISLGTSPWNRRANNIFYQLGNVGIGTNDPETRLDVEGNIHVRGSENGGDNDNVALIIESEDANGLETMILDGNELDCINDVLGINANTDNNVVIASGGGNVGIGNFWRSNQPEPTATLHVRHQDDLSSGISIQNEDGLNNIWNLHSARNPNNLVFVNRGNIVALINRQGEFIEISDARLKSHITPLYSTLEKVLELAPKTYHMEGTDKRKIGFLAQDVEKLFPEAVWYDADLDKYMLNYDTFGVLAIKAIQEQQKQIEQQQAQLERQQVLLNELERRIEKLEN